jgi:hypothetical protein
MRKVLALVAVLLALTDMYAQEKRSLPTDPGPLGWAENDDNRIYEVYQVDTLPVILSPERSMPKCVPNWGDPVCFEHTTVYLSFVVERDGTVSDPKGVGLACAELVEAARCTVAGKYNWKPGVRKGMPVRTRLVYPFTFPAVF